jgi:hypothetical protein
MELANLISVYTCWASEPCETFLLSDRKEIVDLPDCNKECDVFVFDPFYTPFDKESFTFTVIEQKGLEENTIPIEAIYSEVDGNFRMELPLHGCKCRPTCGCDPKYKLVVEYAAGYEEIPDCLLPVFCEALQYIKEKNTCDCSECQTCNVDYGKVEIDYENGTITDRLEGFFNEMLTAQYKRQLSLISLCRNERVWGFVV